MNTLKEETVLDFLINHYVANNVLIYGDARDAMFQLYPELTDEDKLQNDPNLLSQRKIIDSCCSVENLSKTERNYFKGGPPNVADNGENPEYKSMCKHIRDNLTYLVEKEGIEIQDYNKMVKAWETALCYAIGQKGTYTDKIGDNKLVHIYHTHPALTFFKEKPLVNEFVDRTLSAELNLFRGIYELRIARAALDEALKTEILTRDPPSSVFVSCFVKLDPDFSVEIVEYGAHIHNLKANAEENGINMDKYDLACATTEPHVGLPEPLKSMLKRHI